MKRVETVPTLLDNTGAGAAAAIPPRTNTENFLNISKLLSIIYLNNREVTAFVDTLDATIQTAGDRSDAIKEIHSHFLASVKQMHPIDRFITQALVDSLENDNTIQDAIQQIIDDLQQKKVQIATPQQTHNLLLHSLASKAAFRIFLELENIIIGLQRYLKTTT